MNLPTNDIMNTVWSDQTTEQSLTKVQPKRVLIAIGKFAECRAGHMNLFNWKCTLVHRKLSH